MMKKILLVLFVLCLALPVNAKKTRSQDIITPMTQLEKRQFQTRTYDSTDKALVMKAMLNVLQDEGFIGMELKLQLLKQRRMLLNTERVCVLELILSVNF